jgi:hypothetical protein
MKIQRLKDTRVDGGIDIKMGVQQVEWGAWTGLIWHRVGTNGGLV